MALGRPLLAVDLPGHGHSDGGPEGSVSAGGNGRDLATVIAALAPEARGVVGMSLGGVSSLALAAHAPELVRALVLVDVTPGVNAEKATPITNFINGPASFDSFDELLARTIEHNPGRSESSLRRGILHNAVQREDGSWVWRYARFRTEASGPAVHPEFGDLWEAVSGLTVPLLLVRGLALVRRRRRRRGRAPAAPARRHRDRRRGRGPQHPGGPAARAGRHPRRLPLPGRLMDREGLALTSRPQAPRRHPRRGARLPGAVPVAGQPRPRRQHPQLGLRLRVAPLRRLRRLHVVALRPRGGRGRLAARDRRDRSGGGHRPARKDPRSRRRTRSSRPTTRTWPSWRSGTGPPGADSCSGGRARTSNIRLQRPTFCRLNYPGPRRSPPRG